MKRKKRESVRFFRQPDPFEGSAPGERTAAFVEAGRNAAVEFEKQLAALKGLVRNIDRTHVISTIVRYGLYRTFDENGKFRRNDSTLTAADLEFLQALVLCVPPTGPIERATPEVIQKIWDSLEAVGAAFTVKRFERVGQAADDTAKQVQMIQELVRAHRQWLRNTDSYGYAQRVAAGIYSTFDSDLKSAVGVSVTELIAIFRSMSAAIQERTNRHTEAFRNMASVDDIGKIAAYYGASLNETDESIAKLVSILTERGQTPESTFQYLLQHHLETISRQHSFLVGELSKASDVPEETVQSALKLLSATPGIVAEEDVESLFLQNPIWTRPIIQLSDDDFYCPLPQLFFSSIHEILQSLVSQDVRIRMQQRRAEYLEDQIEKLFKQGFPDARVIHGVKWNDSGKIFETDLICRIDSHLIIVEAKSGLAHASALRGAPDRLKKHVQELILDPSIQSARLADKLNSVIAGNEKADFFQTPLTIPLEGVTRIIRLSVNLDEFANLQAHVRTLSSAGWAPPGFEWALSMSLADLTTILEILETPAERIHYLVRRSEINAKVSPVGNETDWLGLYLKTGLFLGEIESPGSSLVIAGMSKEIDRYYTAKEAGLPVQKPRLKMTRLWRDMVELIGRRRFDRWSEVAAMLLNVRHSQQENIEDWFRKLARTVRAKRGNKDGQNGMAHLPFPGSPDALVVVALTDFNYGERHSIIGNVADKAMKSFGSKRVLVLVRNVDHENYPYSMLSVAGGNRTA